MHFNHPTVASKDLPIIHKNYLTVAQKFPQNSIRLNYFLSACEFFNDQENFDHDIALKLRPYGGLIGIDNSSLDHQLKSFKVLRLHAVLHDAGVLYTKDTNKDLVALICFRGKAATVLVVICREYCFAYI